ncbi:MAG: LytTR family DNA-binding domain-containing protein [Saprospiraceae bacterium]|nr:LytTR family DNA-binding domain-containing protein [Saprospiraceae bacterium]
MIKVFLLDDEKLALQSLRLLITRYIPELEIVGESQFPEEAIKEIQELKPQILFTDIRMPGMTGIELLLHLQNWNGSVIFTTAYSDYSIRALRLGALDYLLKPIDPNELKQAIERWKEKIAEEKPDYSQLAESLAEKNRRNLRLEIKVNEKRFYVPVSDIVYIEGDRNYSRIYFANKTTQYVSKTMRHYEELLDFKPFMRIHTSYLVNLDFADRIMAGNVLVLKDETELQISRDKKESLIHFLQNPENF